jgi:hypothetical protein
MVLSLKKHSRDSSVGIALGYGLDDRGSRFRFPAGVGNLSLHRRVQNGSGAHPASYPKGTREYFTGGKAAGVVKLTTHLQLLPRSKNAWSYTSTSQYAFVAWCSVESTGITLQLYLYLYGNGMKLGRAFKILTNHSARWTEDNLNLRLRIAQLTGN